MCEIFVNEDISKIDLKQVYQEAEELILEEKFEQGSKLYGKVIWALIQMVRFLNCELSGLRNLLLICPVNLLFPWQDFLCFFKISV